MYYERAIALMYSCLLSLWNYLDVSCVFKKTLIISKSNLIIYFLNSVFFSWIFIEFVIMINIYNSIIKKNDFLIFVNYLIQYYNKILY